MTALRALTPASWRRSRAAIIAALVPVAVPVLVFEFVRRYPVELELRALGLVLGGGVVAALATRPHVALCALLVWWPFAEVVHPYLLKLGLPAAAVRTIGFWKEAMVAALVLAAIRSIRASPRVPDGIDKLALVFLGFVLAYASLAAILPPGGEQVPLDARLVAARQMMIPIIAFGAARHARIDDRWQRWVMASILVSGTFVGMTAIAEITFTDWWDRLLFKTIDLNGYRQQIFGETEFRTTFAVLTDPTLSGQLDRRAGSFFTDSLTTGFFLLLPAAVAMGVVARRARGVALVALGTISVGLLLTQTRSAIGGGIVIALLIVRSRRVLVRHRSRFAFVLAALFMLAIPVLGGSAVGERIVSGITGSDVESRPTHETASREGLALVVDNPLGLGFGLGGGNSVRFDLDGVVSENYFLALAVDVGILGSLAFIVFLGALVRRCAKAPPDDPLPSMVASAIIALSVGGLFLHSWEGYATATMVLATAGMCIDSRADRRTGRPHGFRRHPTAALGPSPASRPSSGAPNVGVARRT